MSSLKTKITLLTVCAIIVSLTVATLLGVLAVNNIGSSSTEQILKLLCETGEKNLDAYFESTEQSVDMIAQFVAEDLRGTDDAQLSDHMDRAREIFFNAASKTNGVLTYYYRIDPSVSDEVKGFWYTNIDGSGFVEHEVTDISLYDTQDTSSIVWFTVPKSTGKAIWLPPYITDNLDVRVISYNVPVYFEGSFIGVVGIEIDYETLARQADNIELYANGYAFIADESGELIYHPRIDAASLSQEDRPDLSDDIFSDGVITKYSYGGIEKEAVRLSLSNGMRLYVTVPVSEINGDWTNLILLIICASVILLVVFIIVTLKFTESITKPLTMLTEAAALVSEGDYDVELDHEGSDEVGVLTATINQLIANLKVYISDLRNLAFADALTSLRNKGAFDIYAKRIENEINDCHECPVFAVGVFDCDDLKSVNDKCGHDKGDIYLKNASKLICKVFKQSPVFRTGGDEFTVILRGEDFENRNMLAKEFQDKCDELCANANAPWERISVSIGVAVFDLETDHNINGVVRRADRLMYENKRSRKARMRLEMG